MMLPITRVYRPETLSEALFLRRDTAAIPLAAGTDIFVMARSGKLKGSELLDISGIKEFRGIRREGDTLVIGALETHRAVSESPLVRRLIPGLSEASSEVGAPQIRARATIGGNICHASPAADTVPALAALGASAVIVSAGGTRELSVTDIMKGPGRTSLKEDELLSSVRVPLGGLSFSGFEKLGGRTALSIAVASCAAAVRDGVLTAAFGSMGPTVLEVPELGDIYRSFLMDPRDADALIPVITDVLRGSLSPITDVRASAEYRLRAAAGLFAALLERAAAKK